MDMPGSRIDIAPARTARSSAWPLVIVLGPMAGNGSLRREFVDVYKPQGSAIADEAIRRIVDLYAVENMARGFFRIIRRHLPPAFC